MNSWWPSYNTQIVLAGGSLLGLCAGVIGCFALLKKRALTGDALAHASLPGLCLAYLIVGSRSMPALLVGAAATGVAGISFMAFLRRWTRIKEDAALGFVLSVPYGLGVVLLSIIQRSPGGNKAGLDHFIQGKAAGMLLEDVYLMMVLVLGTLFKEFRLVSFDPAFAQVQGWPTVWLDFLLMSLVVLVVVIGLPTVGILLMAALLIIPPAAARFWTDRLGIMTFLAGMFGMIAGMVGTLISARYETIPTGPAIILTASVLFIVSFFLAPRRGLLARWFGSGLLPEEVRA
jgi:manganese/zinc/iron transport system permease protein